MKRPMLVCGITLSVVSAFLVLYSKIAAIVTIILAASVFILYLIKPLKLRKFIIIPTVCISSIIITMFFGLYTNFKITPLKQYDGQITDVSGVVYTLPKKSNDYIKITLKADIINQKNENIKIDVLLTPESAENIKLYDYITLKNAELSLPRNDKLDYDLTAASDGVLLNAYAENTSFLYKSEKDIFYYCLNLKKIVSEKIDLYLSTNTAGILKGMLFGGSESIDNSTLTAFRSSGIAHLLAVSGLHTSLWCGLLLAILKFFKLKDKLKNTACILLLFLLYIVSGLSPSVARASLMMLMVLIAPFFKRIPDSLNSLGVAVSVLLLCNPYAIASISFQLSAAATFGVIIAVNLQKRIIEKSEKIKIKPLRKFIIFALSTLIISVFASLFTLPISAYHFGTFCIFSPLTNLLCTQLAFYGMVAGTMATALSFINVHLLQSISIFIFKVTDTLLNLVIKSSQFVTNFKFCTIPIHKNWFITGLIICATILFIGYIISKNKGRKKFSPITAIIAVIALFSNIFIPILPTPFADTVTVVATGDNINLVVRSGLHYAYITNATEPFDNNVYSYLPKATCEELDYLLASYVADSSLKNFSNTAKRLNPTETHITTAMSQIAETRDITFPKNTIVSVEGKYNLGDKISIEIVDTYHMRYAIMRGSDKVIMVHLYGSTDFSNVDEINAADIFIYNGTTPKKIPANAQTVIISADSTIYNDNNIYTVKQKCSDTLVTAADGDIQFTI